MDANGITTVTPWNKIFLTGTEDMNIFDISGSDLDNAKGLVFDIGPDDIAIVNVSGDINEFSAFGIFGTEGKEGNILYNFYDSDQLSIHKIAVKGSILAPSADVLFNSGRIDGTLIADSVRGTGQFNSYGFDRDVPTTVVPEPSTITLFLSGATILLGFKKRI
jgi:choice-of-anchor A domain-containing protein